MIREANSVSLSRSLINLGMGTVLFYTSISTLLFIEFQFPKIHFDIHRLRSIIVLIYNIIFIWNMYVINRYSKSVVERQMTIDRNNHYRKLDSYNR